MKLHKNFSIVILSHYYKRTTEGGGPPQDVRDLLLQKVEYIVYIEHAFPYAKDTRSSMTIYKNGVKIRELFTPRLFGPQIFFYIFDIFITFYFLLRAWKRYDLCIALDNLNTVSVFPLRKFGLITKLVFYTIDYTPLRFPNKLLNRIYQFTDKVACYTSDAIWVLSRRMTEARLKNGVDSKKTAPSILLPIGAKLDRIAPLPLNKINRYDIIFVGHLLEKQGVQLILDALPLVIKRVPQVRFVIVGQGEYESSLRKQVLELGINNHVTFKGFIEKHEDVEKLLCKSAIGLAPYIPAADNYTYYTDPGKPKLYLACGLPVIITNVPQSAEIIHQAKAGISIPYEKKAFQTALLQLLTNDTIYSEYRLHAIQLSKEFNTDTLIQKALDTI